MDDNLIINFFYSSVNQLRTIYKTIYFFNITLSTNHLTLSQGTKWYENTSTYPYIDFYLREGGGGREAVAEYVSNTFYFRIDTQTIKQTRGKSDRVQSTRISIKGFNQSLLDCFNFPSVILCFVRRSECFFNLFKK